MAVRFSDDFNRADGDIGANYTDNRNAMRVFSNGVGVDVGGNDCYAYVNTYSSPANQWASFTVTVATAASRSYGAGLRMPAAGNRNGYFGGNDRFNSGSNNYEITGYVGGVYQGTIAAGTNTPAPGDLVYFEAVGTTLSLYVNGVLECSGTNAGLASGQPGIYVTDPSASVTLMDNFSSGDFILQLPTSRSISARMAELDAEDDGRFRDLDIRNWFKTAGGILCPA